MKKKGAAGLIAWCQAQLSDEQYSNAPVDNLTSSFANGLVLCALVHKLDPTLLVYDALRPQNALNNCELALDLFCDHFDVPPLLDATDVASGPDSRSIQLYLSYIIKVYKQRFGDNVMKVVVEEPRSRNSSPLSRHSVSSPFTASQPTLPSMARRRSPEPTPAASKQRPARRAEQATTIQTFVTAPRMQKLEEVVEKKEREQLQAPPTIVLSGNDAVDVGQMQKELRESKAEVEKLKALVVELEAKAAAPAPVVIDDEEAQARLEDLEMQVEMLQMSLDDSRATVLELQAARKSKKGSRHVRRVSWAPAVAADLMSKSEPSSPDNDTPRTSRLRKKLKEALHSVEGLNKELDAANRRARKAQREVQELREENERLERRMKNT